MNATKVSPRRPGFRWLARLLLTGALLPGLTPAAQAAPRVGTHDGFTRLVFELPGDATPTVQLQGQSVTVVLNVALRPEQGPLRAAGVTAYAVAGHRVTVTLAGGHAQARASVLPASGAQKARLVIDVPTSAAARVTPASPGARPGIVTPAAVARPASTAPLSPPPAVRPQVVLDAGHGGIDPGAQSRWVSEEEVTLDIALRTRAELVQHGVDVVMVRESDRHLSANKSLDLEARSRLAKNGTVSAFVSIHVNSASPSAQGIETYYFGQPMAGRNRTLAVQENGGGSVGETLTRQAASSAQNMLGDILAQAKIAFSRELAAKVQSSLVVATGAVSRGVQTDAFYVIRNPTTPAVLVEVGFGSSPVEGPRLAQPAYRERIAQALARAILNFLNTK